jgi:hypothetical protein
LRRNVRALLHSGVSSELRCRFRGLGADLQ